MWPFRKKSLSDHLRDTKRIKVMGMFFHIRKINPLDFLEGANALKQAYDVYTVSNDVTKINTKKVFKQYVDVLMAGVVEPKLSRKDDGSGLFVEKLFTDWGLVDELHTAIYEYTYGKKKIRRATSRVKGF